MKTNVVALLAFFCSFNSQAYSNFIENPHKLYPPGCATLLDLQTILYGDNAVKVFDGEIELLRAPKSLASLPANLAVYRVGCADGNRSLVLFEFSIPDRLDPASTYYRVPRVDAIDTVDGYDTWTTLRLLRDPSDWGGTGFARSDEIFGGNSEGTTDGHDRTWVFVLDNAFYPYPNIFAGHISPSTYNDSFQLWIETAPAGWGITVTIDPTASLLAANPRIPLNGRLSGNWVAEGATDQGFVIAISELVPNSVPAPAELQDSPLLMFLSWYTYDTNGHKLWLTGSSQFVMGETEITIPIEKVTHGEFMGSKTADRSVVGSVTITANNCNDLTLQYNLSDIGLGSGTEHLQRLFSLETAGYVCRDLEARMAAK